MSHPVAVLLLGFVAVRALLPQRVLAAEAVHMPREEVALRQAIDPVIGQTVDQASAITAAAPDGSIFDFESEQSFERFRAER